MLAIVAALAVSYALTRHLPVDAGRHRDHRASCSAALTLVLQDETFIKLKPTIIYLLFGARAARRACCSASRCWAWCSIRCFNLTDEGWRKLTLRWALFFFALAVLNEIVWRTQSDRLWVSFKVFGFLPLTFVFAAAAVSAADEIRGAGDEATSK